MHIMIRQHPIKVIMYLYQSIRYTIIPYTLLLFNEIRAGTGEQPYWVYGLATAVGIGIAIWSIVSWWKDSYHIDDDAIILRHGVFYTTQRTIPLERITNISTEMFWVDKLVRAVTIQLQTSDSDEAADATLVLTSRQANLVISAIKEHREGSISNSSYEKSQTNILFGMPNWTASPKDIWMRSISSNTFWLGVPFCISLVTYLWKWLEPPLDHNNETSLVYFFKNEMWKEILSSDFISVLFALFGIIFLCVLVSWFVSMIMMQIRYYQWTVVRNNDKLDIQYGWHEKKLLSLQVNKIQSIRLKEHLLIRPFGYISVWMDCVGYTGEKKARILLPAIHKNRLRAAFETLLPEFDLPIPERRLPMGKEIYFIWMPVLTAFLIIVIASLFSTWAWIAAILLTIVYGVGKNKYRCTMWDTQRQCIIAKPGLVKTTVYIKREAIQTIDYSQNRLHRLFGIYRIEFILDSPSKTNEYIFTGAEPEDLTLLLTWYKNV
ncbi:PH domain-containing protein [Paenibacillus sp. 1001270B_150601_E10]|uniref:PH domain-containing protein n=1 Tax=Paenibacillus sp. 1001270B_150601_E10 TaxID=2787079 RepID=UPI00189FCF70|nr:PH domain-containing protein [Paenibacillus sp. 1001270B_150601_E10]